MINSGGTNLETINALINGGNQSSNNTNITIGPMNPIANNDGNSEAARGDVVRVLEEIRL